MPCKFCVYIILNIYMQCLFNKNELYAYLAQVKLVLEMEYNIYKNFQKFNLCMTTYNKNIYT